MSKKRKHQPTFLVVCSNTQQTFESLFAYSEKYEKVIRDLFLEMKDVANLIVQYSDKHLFDLSCVLAFQTRKTWNDIQVEWLCLHVQNAHPVLCLTSSEFIQLIGNQKSPFHIGESWEDCLVGSLLHKIRVNPDRETRRGYNYVWPSNHFCSSYIMWSWETVQHLYCDCILYDKLEHVVTYNRVNA
jgi:hypothetical protein